MAAASLRSPAVIFSYSFDNLPAIIEARMALELGLVTIAAEKINDSQLERLQETIDIIANSTDNHYGEADKEFHRIIALTFPIWNLAVDFGVCDQERLNHPFKHRVVRAQSDNPVKFLIRFSIMIIRAVCDCRISYEYFESPSTKGPISSLSPYV